MKNHVNALQSVCNHLWVTHIAQDKFHLGIQIIGFLILLPQTTVHLGFKVIQHPHLVTIPEQGINNVGANETRPTSNKDFF